MPDSPENDLSLADLVARLFGGASDRELPAYEKKGFYLSKSALDQHADKIVETIAAIANGGFENGMILCSGTGDVPPEVDAEQIDAKVRAVVGPAVPISFSREVVNGRTVDIIRVPRSRLRPHVLRDKSSNRFYIPLRGAANNATSARHEIDEMMREQLLDTLRAAFPTIQVDGGDEVTREIQAIGLGLDPSTDGPQVSILVVPTVLKRRIEVGVTSNERRTDMRLFDLVNKSVNAGHHDYYSVAGSLGTRVGEDFFESNESSIGEKPVVLCANRLYFNGIVARRSVVWQATRSGSWDLDWLSNQVSATLHYALFAYDEFHVSGFSDVQIFAVLKGVMRFPIRTTNFLGTKLAAPRAADDLVIVPSRERLVVERPRLRDKAKDVAAEIARITRTYFE